MHISCDCFVDDDDDEIVGLNHGDLLSVAMIKEMSCGRGNYEESN